MEDKNVKFAPAKRIPKKKVCVFCVDKVDSIDYKDATKLRRFTTEKGKILPRRMSGVCAVSGQPVCLFLRQLLRHPARKLHAGGICPPGLL